MRGKINTRGQLTLQRNGFGEDKFFPQACRFSPKDDACDIYCPLFGEPKNVNVMGDPLDGSIKGTLMVQLNLCHSKLFLQTLISEM